MSEMVKQAAEAIEPTLEKYIQEEADAADVVRAVLDAVREPTDEMIQSVRKLSGYILENDYIREEWYRMIDEALK